MGTQGEIDEDLTIICSEASGTSGDINQEKVHGLINFVFCF